MKNQQTFIYKNFLVSLRSHSKIKNSLSPCLTFSLLHCRHIAYLRIRTLPTNLVIWYVITSLCHACYISEYVYLHIFHVNSLLKRQLFRGHRISCHAPPGTD